MIHILTQYFNMMAIIIRKLLSKKDSWNEQDYESVLGDAENRYHVRLSEVVPDLIGKHRGYKSIYMRELNSDFFNQIEQLIKEDDLYQMLLLLNYMDKAIVKCYDSQINFEEDVVELKSLNSNEDETGIIVLKKVKCNWENRSIGLNVENIMTYFYFVCREEVGNVNLKNYIISDNYVFRYGKERLRIAISPVRKEKITLFSDCYTRTNQKTGSPQYLFRVEGILDEDQITNIIIQNILNAGNEQVDILVFPEMIGTEKMIKKILLHISEEDNNVPPLVVLPSVWQKTEDDVDNTNISYVLLNGEEIIIGQPKRHSFHMKADNHTIFEDINSEAHNEMSFLHIEGIGRIGIVICYDYLEKNNRRMILDHLKPSLICTPAFSTGSFHFRIITQDGFSQYCNWVWCNTCAAACEGGKEDNFNKIGIITKLSRQCNPSDFHLLYEEFNGKTLCDKKECGNCIFYSDIPLSFSNKKKNHFDKVEME